MTPKKKSILFTSLFILAFAGYIYLCYTFPFIMAPILMTAATLGVIYTVYKSSLMYFSLKK